MSDDNGARLTLPYLAAGQMQKHVTLNEALTRLDALVQAAVISRMTAAQPADPEDGDLYILPDGAEGGAWDGRPEGALMRFEAGGWIVVPAPDGMVAVVLDAGELVVRHEGGWRLLGDLLGEVQQLTRLGLGATADADNPFAAKLNKALWTALETGDGGDGDLRLTLNKQGAADVLSLLFQSGYGGRAELGLIGDDDLRLKVSGDGSTWHEALSVDRATGRVTAALGVLRSEDTILTADGSWTAPVWARRVEVLCVGAGGGGGGGQFGAAGTDRFGGGGGGAGGVSLAVWPAEALTGALTVTVGAGGFGGASSTAGQSGEASGLILGGVTLLTGAGGQGGSATGAGGAGGIGVPISNSGGASLLAATGQTGGAVSHPLAAAGGGGGGALDSSNTARHGGPGGDGGVLAVTSGGGSGGSGAGGDGVAAADLDLGWTGGGGGGGGASVAGTGHPGGDGGIHGAGGGGGGAGLSAGGAGGDGSGGLVILRAIG
ncbi:MAG: DUF2793 domain-containing protein [Pseudomonadota bacterium]